MRYLYTILSVLIPGLCTVAYGGPVPKDNNQNYLEVNSSGNLNFTVNEPADFENKQTLYNAIRLKFKSKDEDCSMYVRVSEYIVPSGASRSSVPLEIELKSNDAKKLKSVVNGPIQLTTTDRLLFTVDKASNTNNFDYDLSLLPLGYSYPEGQYRFTITFTMTQP